VVNEADKPGQIDQFDPIRDVERLLLEAANAIQRLISERDELRRRVDTLEREAANLRERTTLIQDSYRRLTNEVVTQLQLLDSSTGELFQEPARPGTFSHSKERPQEG
jgi:hypothetical protein